MTESGPLSWSLRARWLFPVAQPPLEGGVITIRGERIEAITARPERPLDFDLGNAAILPGLVNAHTHLDLSGLRGRLPPGDDFPAWLHGVIRHRRGLTPPQVEAAIRAGLAESLAHGTTLLGDVAGQGLSWPLVAAAPLWGVVFYELLGLPRDRARQAWHAALAWLQDHPATATCRSGLSPHAPYSVRAALFRAVAAAARQRHLPVAIHLAETAAERELLQTHQGPLRDFLTGLGVWDARGLVRRFEDLPRRFADTVPTAFIHGNYLSPVAPIAPGSAVVYCPRTHAAFGHPPHPLRQLLDAGVCVALGTDSLASNPDLDVLAEARFLHRLYPDIPGPAVLRMATLAGAEALGWDRQTGSLEPGKSADLVVLPLEDTPTPDPHRLVLESAAPVRAVLWRGRWVHGAAP
jgi:cytosine/adenosine deaminase-related metal-dependent hydrolase